MSVSASEPVGLINRKRYQKDGYSISAGFGAGIGLDDNSPFYQSVSLNAVFYKLLNRIIELSARFSTVYTTSTTPSLIHYLGPGNVKGLITGEESGQGYYSGNIAAGFTYFNRNWFALEQNIYTNFGKANDRYFNIYKTMPRISLLTVFRICIPMIP